jgi:hypothetical protein
LFQRRHNVYEPDDLFIAVSGVRRGGGKGWRIEYAFTPFTYLENTKILLPRGYLGFGWDAYWIYFENNGSNTLDQNKYAFMRDGVNDMSNVGPVEYSQALYQYVFVTSQGIFRTMDGGHSYEQVFKTKHP